LASDLSAVWNQSTDSLHRAFTDPDGVEWKVWEVHPSSVDHAANKLGGRVAPDLQNGWLCFESDAGEKRRLAPIPLDWQKFFFSRLIALWRRASVVHKGRREDH
jgi:hypothetical protein